MTPQEFEEFLRRQNNQSEMPDPNSYGDYLDTLATEDPEKMVSQIPKAGYAEQAMPQPRALASKPAVSNDGTSDIVKSFLMSRQAPEQNNDMEFMREGYRTMGQNQLNAQLGKSFAQIGQGISGADKVDTSVFDDLNKNAGQAVEMGASLNKMKKELAALDPNSPRAQVYKRLIAKAYPNYAKDLDGLTYADAKDASGIIQDAEKTRATIEENRLKRAEDSRFKTADLEIKRAQLGKDKALGAVEKKELFQAEQGQKAVEGMRRAFANGDSTFSMWGDNQFTLEARAAAEMYGRLQSGGAINKEEEKNFLKMLPRWDDDPEIQRQKLEKAMSYFTDRQRAYGRTPQASTASGPQPGEVKKGYKFLGGNPADKNSWEKI